MSPSTGCRFWRFWMDAWKLWYRVRDSLTPEQRAWIKARLAAGDKASDVAKRVLKQTKRLSVAYAVLLFTDEMDERL